MFYLNKPFSPHITIYNIQTSSLVSILHRIAAILLLILFIYVLFVYEFCLNIFYYDSLILYKLTYVLFLFFTYFFTFFSFFHFINGWKIILWNCQVFTKFKYLNSLNIILLVFILIIVLQF
nr:succinate dehydrogenase subunit 3 [Neorhodomela munita]